jgi:hypothetical protein
MAYVPLVGQANIGPGVVQSPADAPDLAVPAPFDKTQLDLRVNPNAADWADPTLTARVDCWSSADGVSFNHYCGGFVAYGNTFDAKTGTLPPAYGVFFPAGTQKVRWRVDLNKKFRLGLDGQWS